MVTWKRFLSRVNLVPLRDVSRARGIREVFDAVYHPHVRDLSPGDHLNGGRDHMAGTPRYSYLSLIACAQPHSD
jgi:hypothetical protein